MTDLPKTFDPAAIEQRWYEHWESEGLFRPDRPEAKPWTIVMPPPNVTGSLHIGHALDITLQDVLTRRERMLGKDALWVVGTDHAGIATQMVVERNLDSQGIKRAEIGREAFLEHVWEWKAQSGGAITRQLRRLGASCDWAHERFTMDEGYQRAVTHVFVELHKRGLVYRDKRLVNWDPKFQTAISDLEVETSDVQGKFWTLSYPLADNSGAIQVATTRPETMLADMAVAVHPGRRALQGADRQADQAPDHRPADPDHRRRACRSGARLRRGQDHAGPRLQRLSRSASAPGSSPPTCSTCSMRRRSSSRRRMASSRRTCSAWRARRRARRSSQARGRRRAGPRRGPRHPDAVRRPLGRGDRAVADRPMVCRRRQARAARAPGGEEGRHQDRARNLGQDLVQLAREHPALVRLAPAVVGPPHSGVVRRGRQSFRRRDAKKKRASRLATSRCGRTTMSSTHGSPPRSGRSPRSAGPRRPMTSSATTPTTSSSPASTSCSSGMRAWRCRASSSWARRRGRRSTSTASSATRRAQKMSKSKGNTVDPLGLIDKYGADALRFTLAAMESQGRDIKLDEKRVEGYRNFATKLWNAARFLQMNGVGASDSIAAPAAELPVNRWIIGEVVETLAKLDRAFDELRYDEMADAIYHFVWGTFCDWYVELVKGAFDEETKRVAAWAFDQILVMLHPLMPFITEELWNANGRAAVRADRRQMAGAAGAGRSACEGASSTGSCASSAKSVRRGPS